MLENGKLSPMDARVGDTVLYGKYSGTEVTLDGKEYTILRQEDVLAIIKEELAGAKA